ncbi:ROK family transcriptional regulator [Thalassospira sp. TSL5-1]|uniref:ROK family transcriptional regulator n=1 Tax=Thalassospira sp. TSL5-1 TaxID=1544451 RepID=UPI00093E6A5B|nr:ROK family transcriptional regulator [Thalassospira sp. TSL5-1]OKH86838.1 Xyl repressor [Thalassospira sp. TSL5-1]
MSRRSASDIPRQPSQIAILRYLRLHGPVARIDIGNATGLSPASVTSLTADLIAQGLVQEIQSVPGTNDGSNGASGSGLDPHGGITGAAAGSGNARGRPKVLLDLVPTAAYVIGIKITINLIEIALGNFKGDIERISEHRIQTRDLDEHSLITTLCALIEQFIAEHTDVMARNPAGISIALQGVADNNSGEIMWSPALRHRQIAVTEPLRARYGGLVMMSNDANCIATAITQNTALHHGGDFAVIMLGYGIGMGLVLNGTVYNGPFGAAAEFGHMKYQPDGPLCNCGKRGCLEAYIGDYAILRDASALTDMPNDTTISNRLHPSEHQMMALVDKARCGNEEFADLFRHAGKVLGYGIANLIALLGPERIFITGSGARAFDLMEPDLHRSLQDAQVPELRRGPQIVHLPWDKDIAIQGAIGQCLLRYDENMFVVRP